MKQPAVCDEIPTRLVALMPEQLEQVAGGSRHKLDKEYGGLNGFYYGPAKS
jgi:hypothetical protein